MRIFLLSFLLILIGLSSVDAQPVRVGPKPKKKKKPPKEKPVKVTTNDDDIKLLPGLANLKPKNALQIANDLYDIGDKAGAYHYYLAYFKKKRNNKFVKYRLSETALLVRNYLGAKRFSQDLLKQEKYYRDIRYYYGQSLKYLGEYDKASTELTKYMIFRNLADEDSAQVANIIEGCVIGSNVRPDRSFKVVPLTNEVNTNFSENGAIGYGNQMLFTHIGEQGSIIRNATSPNGNSASIKDYSAKINRAGFQNSDPFLADGGKTLFFSRCGVTSSGGADCSIYMAKITADGSVSEVRKLNKGINQPGYLSLQPALTKNEFGREILYFVSNRPGGQGGFDIWYSMRLNDGSFTRSYNVGTKINTPYNETSPFYRNDNETLYYSSDDPKGLGGFDIYSIKGLQRYWDKPYNLSIPINSSADDYYLRLGIDGAGYLSSNRAGTLFDMYENCCDDIFRVTKEE